MLREVDLTRGVPADVALRDRIVFVASSLVLEMGGLDTVRAAFPEDEAELVAAEVERSRWVSPRPGRSPSWSRGDPWQPSALKANFARALKRAGLDGRGLIPYSTRHTFSTAWPGSIRDLQAVLGHTQLATTMRHAAAVEDRMNRSVADIDHGLQPPAPIRKAK